MNPATETDRVRRYTSAEMLRQIEERIEHNIKFYAAQPTEVVEQRIAELEREWSIERYLQVNVCTVGLLTTFLALTSNRKWAVLTCGALGFFLYHGLRGFDPPIPLLRRMGIRTRKEIDREKYALKALLGEFRAAPIERRQMPEVPTELIMRAVNA
jgi:hypothetical protein